MTSLTVGKSMTNEELYTEMMRIGKLTNELLKQNRYAERNELVKRYRELKALYKFPFAVGDEVNVSTCKRPHRIKNIESHDRFLIEDTNGWEKIVCGTMLTKIIKDNSEQKTDDMQLNLFEH